MRSIYPHAFIEIRLIEIVRPRDIHVIEACYLGRLISVLVRKSILLTTLLHYDDPGSAVGA